MARRIFLNLPVRDVAAATAFYEAIGFAKDPMFSGERASAMVWSDAIYVMLLHHDFYRTFTDKEIIDAKRTSGALITLSFDSREDVDAFASAAMAAGGLELHGAEDLGFMYSRAFEDLDGHGYGPMYIDLAAFRQANSPEAEPQPA